MKYKTVEQILESAGFPQPVIVLDFETYFDTEYTLKKLSTIEYIMDDRFEVLGVSVYSNGFKHGFSCGEEETKEKLEQLQRHYGNNLERCTVVGHNAKFDCAVLKWRYGICPKYIIDTLGLAQHWDARAKNGLSDLSKRFGLPPKGDTLEFKEWTNRTRFKKKGGRGKHKNMPVQLPKITAEGWKKLSSYADHDGWLEVQLFEKLLPRMSRPDVELEAMNHTLHMYLEPRIQVDYEAAEQLITEIDAEIDKAVGAVGCSRETISGELSFETHMVQALIDAGDNVSIYMKPAKNKRGQKLAIAKTDPQQEMLLKHEDDTVRSLMEAKIAIQSWPNHIKRVNRIVNQCKAAGGYLPVPLAYYGAHTGRWSGSEKINLQNLGSRGHELVNRIRTLLIAPPGYEFVIADASSIESRGLAWVADERWKIDSYAAGEEQYCRFAEVVLGKKKGSIRKPIPEDKWEELGCVPLVEKLYKKYRNVYGKTGDLACGYGGGEAAVERFAPSLDLGMRLKIRDTYRRLHPKTVAYWKELEKKFVYVAKFGKPCVMKNGVKLYGLSDVDVVICLPSGREIKYHKVKVDKSGKYGQEQAKVYNPKEHNWEYIWGGTLAENVVQALARDFLWEAIRGMLHRHRTVVHHVHDEMILLVKKGEGQTVLAEAIECLSRTPDWGGDCPLAGEGVVSTRYGDH